jgi:hypothetical protein
LIKYVALGNCVIPYFSFKEGSRTWERTDWIDIIREETDWCVTVEIAD